MQLSTPFDLILIGASVRGAARSALLGGLRPLCVDLFADADLTARHTALRIDSLSALAGSTLDALPHLPWCYTGGLENLPDVVERLSLARPLWGVNAKALRRVRQPFLVAEALQRAGCRMPRITSDRAKAPTDGSWLVKKYHSSGGLGVAVWRGDEPPASDASDERASPADQAGRYFQQRLDGPATSTVFVAAGGRAVLCGAARQYTGRFGAGPFNYSGSLGPLSLTSTHRAEWELIGATLAQEFDLTGVFGVDTIVHRQRLYVVDVNPRWPASAELYDEAFPGESLLAQHVAACRDGRLPTAPGAPTRYVGKGVLFADQPLHIDDETTAQLLSLSLAEPPSVADVPPAGTTIQVGEPICTVFGRGDSVLQASRSLAESVRRLKQLIESRQPSVDQPTRASTQ